MPAGPVPCPPHRRAATCFKEGDLLQCAVAGFGSKFPSHHDTVEGCEILHQLVYGLSPDKIPLFTVFHSYLTFANLQDFFHPQ